MSKSGHHFVYLFQYLHTVPLKIFFLKVCLERKYYVVLVCRILRDLWLNLKNLSGGLNLSRGLNMVDSTLNCIKCFKI